ncbi:unnamed protein product [Camellia sinensis]
MIIVLSNYSNITIRSPAYEIPLNCDVSVWIKASKASVEVKPKDESKNRTTMAQVVSLDIDPKQKPIASCRFCLADCSLGSALLQVQSEERVAERES